MKINTDKSIEGTVLYNPKFCKDEDVRYVIDAFNIEDFCEYYGHELGEYGELTFFISKILPSEKIENLEVRTKSTLKDDIQAYFYEEIELLIDEYRYWNEEDEEDEENEFYIAQKYSSRNDDLSLSSFFLIIAKIFTVFILACLLIFAIILICI